MKLIKIILFSFFLFPTLVFSKTRQEVINDAGIYANYTWEPQEKNLLDISKCEIIAVNDVNIATISIGSNNIDDRREQPKDTNNDGVKDKCDISSANWPFVAGSAYTGEAYAWAGYSDYGKWGADTMGVFGGRIGNSAQKWIVGTRDVDVAASGTETIMPEGYTGFTGIDCSGFVGNVLDIGRFAFDGYKLNVSQIKGKSLVIELKDMKKGDIFASRGHILVFNGWVVKYSLAKVIHSVAYSYSGNIHMRRILSEDVAVKKDASGVVKLYNAHEASPYVTHGAYSPFPVFTDLSVSSYTAVTENRPKIKARIKSATTISESNIKIQIDDIAVTPTITSGENYYDLTYTPTEQ